MCYKSILVLGQDRKGFYRPASMISEQYCLLSNILPPLKDGMDIARLVKSITNL